MLVVPVLGIAIKFMVRKTMLADSEVPAATVVFLLGSQRWCANHADVFRHDLGTLLSATHAAAVQASISASWVT